jgi:hypothetical protein
VCCFVVNSHHAIGIHDIPVSIAGEASQEVHLARSVEGKDHYPFRPLRVAGHHVVKGGRKLVTKKLVIFGKHNSPLSVFFTFYTLHYLLLPRHLPKGKFEDTQNECWTLGFGYLKETQLPGARQRLSTAMDIQWPIYHSSELCARALQRGLKNRTMLAIQGFCSTPAK